MMNGICGGIREALAGVGTTILYPAPAASWKPRGTAHLHSARVFLARGGSMETGRAVATQRSEDQRPFAALRAGDEKAFLAIVQRLHPSMLRVASAFVSSRAVAEEVVQEAWLGVLKGLEQFEGRSSLRHWIFGILTNCARSRGVRESRTVPFSSLEAEGDEGPAVDPSRFRPPDDSHWPGHWSAPPTPWADEQLQHREAVLAAQRAIETLPAS